MLSDTTPPQGPIDTGNPALNSLIQRGLLLVSGGLAAWTTAWLTAKGWYDPNWGWLITLVAFSVASAVGVLIWGWVKNTRLLDFINEIQRSAVQAGINLTASGNAITQGGNPIIAHGVGVGAETPKPVTLTAAKEIVASFAERRITVSPKAA